MEEFWAVYSHLIRPSKMAIATDYHLFKEGITPLWEDAKNKEGGKWMIRIKKQCTNRLWETLMLCVIGEQFGVCGESINGIVVSLRYQEDILALWNASPDRGVRDGLHSALRKQLKLPNQTSVEEKFHKENFRVNGEMRDEILVYDLCLTKF